MSSLILVVDDESDVEMLFRQQFRRDLRTGRFAMDFARSADLNQASLHRARHRPKPSRKCYRLPQLATSSGKSRRPNEGMIGRRNSCADSSHCLSPPCSL
jgi:hypothetical protein